MRKEYVCVYDCPRIDFMASFSNILQLPLVERRVTYDLISKVGVPGFGLKLHCNLFVRVQLAKGKH